MATIEKRRAKGGTLRYRVKIRSKGRRHESATFKRLTDARAYACLSRAWRATHSAGCPVAQH